MMMMQQQMQALPMMMQGYMSSLSQMIAGQQAQQQQTPMPSVVRAPDVDWGEKQKEIAQKMKADYTLDQARRKGRSDTILTSPLLDSDDSSVFGSSILTGEKK